MDSIEQEFDDDSKKKAELDDKKYKTRKEEIFDDSNSSDSCHEDKDGGDHQTEIQVAYNQVKRSNEFGMPNPSLQKHYCLFFDKLLKIEQLKSQFPVQSANLTDDGTKAIVLSRKNESQLWIQLFDLRTYNSVFYE